MVELQGEVVEQVGEEEGMRMGISVLAEGVEVVAPADSSVVAAEADMV